MPDSPTAPVAAYNLVGPVLAISSVRFDVILYGGENGDIPIIAWDFKTGGAKLTTSRIEHMQRVSGLDIPIVELRGD